MMNLRSVLGVLALLAIAGGLHSQQKTGDWIELFNGKDTKGWKLRGEKITLHMRFRGGAARTVTLPNPLRSWEGWMTDAEVVAKIDQLLNTQTFSEIAATLNRNGFRSGKGLRFTPRYIARIQKQYALRSRFDRLRALGLLKRLQRVGVFMLPLEPTGQAGDCLRFRRARALDAERIAVVVANRA